MSRNVDASKKIFVAIEILSFDFELFIGARFKFVSYNNHKLMFHR